MMRRFASAAIAVLISFISLSAQDAVPREILDRTLFIRNGNIAGTAFKVDYQGKVFLITARHVVAGLPTSKATIQVWQEYIWKDYHTLRTIFPSSAEVDIAIFETEETVSRPYDITPQGKSSGTTFGQQVWFLGYPLEGLGFRYKSATFPFIKRGTISGIDALDQDAIVYYIDGFNNPGFSGGPVVYWNFVRHAYEIAAVVQGYREEAAKTMVNGKQVDTQILVNSGILVAYSIDHAMKAIEQRQKELQVSQ
jgi:Trypsin-like peptidase domain